MRKFLLLLMMLGLICLNAVGFAAAAEIGDAGAVQRPFSERLKIAAAKAGESDGLSKVAVLYVNNANTTYDADIDRAVLENVHAALKTSACEYIDGTEFLGQFNENGIADITQAERADIADVFKGSGVDYVVLVQVEPFVRKEKVTVFTLGKEMTAVVPFKIFDVKSGKYIYNGKFTELAKDSSVIGDVGNKSVALKALETVNAKISGVIASRLAQAKN